MDHEIITQDGEVIESLGNPSSMAVQLQKAEVDQLITTARAYPRSLKHVQGRIMSMATLDEESAEECIYALPRGGKPIKGPSIRFAEILKQSFGNCRAAARVVAVDRIEMFVEAEGVFHDLETNSSTTARVRRRISDRRGKVFNDDMIIVTGNAACSIAMRNAILAGVPKPLWRRAYETVQATITGDVTTLSVNREKALKALAAFGVKPEQIFAALGREGLEDISVDDIGTLRGMFSALKNGEATVEEMFVGTVKASSGHDKVADPLSDEPVKPAEQSQESEQQDAAPEASSETSDALTGEITDTPSDEADSPPGSLDAGDDTPATSPEQQEAGSVSSDSASSADRDPETGILIQFARDVLPRAADPSTPINVLNSIEKRWMAQVAQLSPETQAKAEVIAKSMRALVNGKTSLDAALSYFAGVLDCSEADLGGRADG